MLRTESFKHLAANPSSERRRSLSSESSLARLELAAQGFKRGAHIPSNPGTITDRKALDCVREG